MVEASVTGLFRMLLIIIGVFVIVRFVGQILIAKNNIANQNDMKKREEQAAREKENALKNKGKTKILRQQKGSENDEEIIDVDYTDIKEE